MPSVKYLFLDVVGFTRDRSVEAQSDIIAQLNDIVTQAISSAGIEPSQRILIPTGDGICVALLSPDSPYDIHVQLALTIIANIQHHNETTSDPMRKFQVRMGINENVDNLVTDINGKPNVAGPGVNMAQRIMNCADGGQILVGQIVYEQLSQRQAYMSSFRGFNATAKHGFRFAVYQYTGNDTPGLSTEVPQDFVSPPKVKPKLTKLAAYYLGHALKNRDFFLSKRDDIYLVYAGVVLLYLLALDSIERSQASRYARLNLKAYGEGTKTIEEQYAYYSNLDFVANDELASHIKDDHLGPFSDCFEKIEFSLPSYVFPSDSGMKKLHEEWPDIYKEMSLQV